MAVYEFFKKEFEFRGKHARMAGELCTLNDYEHTYFRRVIDVYVLAAVVGLRVDRKVETDDSPNETKSIFPEQMIGAKEDLDFLMQIMMILENRERMTAEESVKKAFQSVETKEEFEYYRDLFHSYVRGGVEELYERLVLRKGEVDEEFYDEKTANLMALLEQFGAFGEKGRII
ncbi:MAG: hypothetical protein HFH49_07955 [Lachnospiraceae bacterium]|nr:hypothetical protein [Lachnospiraceae bacterium]